MGVYLTSVSLTILTNETTDTLITRVFLDFDGASIYNTLKDSGFELIMDNVKKGDAIDDNKAPERSFKLWNANTGKHKKTLIGHLDAIQGLTFSPDGNVVDITCATKMNGGA